MHSRSPKLHNYWLARHGLVGTYVPLAVKSEGLRAALTLRHAPIAGRTPDAGSSPRRLTRQHPKSAVKEDATRSGGGGFAPFAQTRLHLPQFREQQLQLRPLALIERR